MEVMPEMELLLANQYILYKKYCNKINLSSDQHFCNIFCILEIKGDQESLLIYFSFLFSPNSFVVFKSQNWPHKIITTGWSNIEHSTFYTNNFSQVTLQHYRLTSVFRTKASFKQKQNQNQSYYKDFLLIVDDIVNLNCKVPSSYWNLEKIYRHFC